MFNYDVGYQKSVAPISNFDFWLRYLWFVDTIYRTYLALWIFFCARFNTVKILVFLVHLTHIFTKNCISMIAGGQIDGSNYQRVL